MENYVWPNEKSRSLWRELIRRRYILRRVYVCMCEVYKYKYNVYYMGVQTVLLCCNCEFWFFPHTHRCRNRDFATIIPHQPAKYRERHNEVFLDFEAFLLSTMKERSTLWIHSQIKACMDANDCQPVSLNRNSYWIILCGSRSTWRRCSIPTE